VAKLTEKKHDKLRSGQLASVPELKHKTPPIWNRSANQCNNYCERSESNKAFRRIPLKTH